MDFSNLKKIFYIVAIISMLLSIKSRVFAATLTDFFNNTTQIEKNSAEFTTGYYTVKVPSLIYDYDNILCATFSRNSTHIGILLFSNNKIFVDSNGKLYGEENKPGYYWKTFTTSTTQDFSNYQLSNFDYNGYAPGYIPEWAGYLTDNSSYGSTSLLGAIYDYSNQDSVIIEKNPFIYPSFDNVTEIENGNPDGVYISPGEYSRNDNLYFHLLQIDTGLSNSDASIYYYSDKTFVLNKDSEYFRTWVDPSIEGYYYYIPRYKLGLSQNTSYLYALNNSKNQIQNSQGIYAKDESNGIYDVVQSDTAGVITATEEESDRMKNIEQTLIDNQNSMDNIQNTLTDSNISQNTETDIDTNLNFNNSAPQFSSLFNGFFSRLTTTISDLGNYQDTDVITVYLPIPFTNDTIPISSNFIFSNQNNNFLKNIATLLWYFIFGRYFLYFLINTYWLITNGQFFNNYLTQKEAITDDML